MRRGGDTPPSTPTLYYRVSSRSGLLFIVDNNGVVLQLERGIEWGEEHPAYAVICLRSSQEYCMLANKTKYDDLPGLQYTTIDGTYLTDEQVEAGPEDVTDFYFIYGGHRFEVVNHVPNFTVEPFE